MNADESHKVFVHTFIYCSGQVMSHYPPSPQRMTVLTNIYIPRESHLASAPVGYVGVVEIETSKSRPNVKWIFNCKYVCFAFPQDHS